MPSFSQSRLAARLQERISDRRAEAGLYDEIAALLPLSDEGRVLDVGTGTGLQLRAIHALKPGMALSGLDLSGAAIEVARERLADLEVDLRVGSIERTTYEDGTFDVVTCNASMSYWQDPVACFDEVYRILKPGGAAVLFEPQKEIDLDEVVATIKENLADAGPWRRFLAVNLNRFALRWGRGVGLTLRSEAELSELAGRSRFGEDHRIERVTLQNLPIFACITLVKPEEEPDRG